MPKVNHGRIKPRYNPKPTEREREFHQWAMREFLCGCGCGRQSTVAHHLLSRHKDKRWRRDHEIIVPLDGDCHMQLHLGDARAIERAKHMIELATQVRESAYAEGVL